MRVVALESSPRLGPKAEPTASHASDPSKEWNFGKPDARYEVF